jgi:CheY-like chemotaxis protein
MNTMPEDFAERRVVVVDDNRNFQQVMRVMLRSFGFRRIDVIAEADHFLGHLEHHHVDFAFVDLVMTGTGGSRQAGLSLIRAVRRSPVVVNRAMPMVLVTGHASRGVIVASVEAGADHVLAKPVSPHTVLACLKALKGSERSYGRGADGYFGPDISEARQRLERRLRLSEGRRPEAPRATSLAAPAAGSGRPYPVPGFNVPVRDDSSHFLD